MTARGLWRVWQPDHGERARDVTPITADDADDAVERTHRDDWEGDAEQVYCVQLVIPRLGPGDLDLRGEKVRVVRSMREYEPVFIVSDPVEPARLKARCPDCGRRMLDLGEVERERCRRCSVRAYAKMPEAIR